MLQPNRDGVVQAFTPRRLDSSLHVRVAQRGPDGQPLRPDPLLGQLVIKAAQNLEP